MLESQDHEQAVKRIGKELYSLVGREIPSVFQTKRWISGALDWAMKDEDFKVRLFRFIDVLPSLKSDTLMARILSEYFSSENTPTILKQAVKRLNGAGFLKGMAAGGVKMAVESMALQFIAGRNSKEGIAALLDLRRSGLAFSVDVLGEEVLSEKEVDQHRDTYLALLRDLHEAMAAQPRDSLLDHDPFGELPTWDVSYKLTSFYSQLDPMAWESSLERTLQALNPVLDAIRDFGGSFTIDMEQYYLKDFTLEFFKRLLIERPDLPFPGVVIQAYLRDSEQDVGELIRFAKDAKRRILVRLVKGAYWDYETVVNTQVGWPIPVFTVKADADARYEALTRALLENTTHIRPAIGTHNIRSISNAAAHAERLGLPKEAYEFQMIFGMAEPIRAALVKMGYRVRIYAPVGDLIPGMAYLIRRLLENTYDDSFLRRAFYEGEEIDTLLEKPAPSPADEPPRVPEFANEPPMDFSQGANRTRMANALAARKSQLGKPYPIVVNGRSRLTSTTKASVNPARPEEVVGVIHQATSGDVDAAVHAAREFSREWAGYSVERRANFLFAAAAEARKRRFDLMALEVYEVGKAWKEADGDVAEAIDHLEYYGREAIRIMQRIKLGNYPGEDNRSVYEPLGVAAVISPWNFPIAIPMGMISAALVTGNCVVFKPSSPAAVCGWAIAELFSKVGLPPGALQFIPGPGDEAGDHLMRHPGVDLVAFTGSKDVGLKILKAAADVPDDAKGIKRVIAEMGGKNAVIVDETADLDEAVKGVRDSALGFQGQKCSACSRVIIVGHNAEEFNDRLREAILSLNIGPPERPENTFGPLIDSSAVNKVEYYKRSAEQEGNVILSMEVNSEAGGSGFYHGPCVVTSLPRDAAALKDEIFGPLLVILRTETLDEAIRIANDSPYALTGGLYSRSPEAVEKVKREFRCGNLYINRKITGALVGRQPFGGFGMSGVGTKAGGPDYLKQFVNEKIIAENTLRRGFAPSADKL